MIGRFLSLDLAFSRNSLPAPGNYGAPLLMQGVTVMGMVVNPCSLVLSLLKADSLAITIFDLSPEEDRMPVASLAMQISFAASRGGQVYATPFQQNLYRCFEIHQGKASPGTSTVFERDGPYWRVLNPGKGLSFDDPNSSQLTDPPVEAQPAFSSFKYGGGFYFSILLRVGWTDGAKTTFRVDPEMIVSNNGSTGGPKKP